MYMPEAFSQESGMRLVLHHPRAFPQVDEYGLNLAPNTFTDISDIYFFRVCVIKVIGFPVS